MIEKIIEKIIELSKIQQFNGDYGEIYFVLVVALVTVCLTFFYITIVKCVIAIWNRTCTLMEQKAQQETERIKSKNQHR